MFTKRSILSNLITWITGLLFISTLTQCEDKDHCSAPNHPINKPSIYVAGHVFNNNDIAIAQYWKDGVSIPLTDGTKNNFATGITVVDDVVYVAGYEAEQIFMDVTRSILKYWKHGPEGIEEISLTDDTRFASSEGIAVLDGNVYVVGREWSADGRNHVAKYWKHGPAGLEVVQLTNCPDGCLISSGEAYKILVSGNNLLIAGSDYAVNRERIAVFWKIQSDRISKISLTDGINESRGAGIALWGDLVYVSGTQYRSGIGYVPVFWKTGISGTEEIEEVVLSFENPESVAYSVAVAETGVHLVGWDNFRAKYWKHSSEEIVDIPFGSDFDSALSVEVSGDKVFIVGGSEKATIWINGQRQVLGDLGNGSMAWSVFVVD